MATYKLIQDIEAEDHILGPLTLRQFIFGLVGAFMYYLCFIAIAKHVLFLLVIFLPPALFCTFFAIPFGRDQPTEVWALAKLRFLFKPRRRVWDQSSVKELVTITAPKKVERVLTKGFDQAEVQSRLKALANTLDSRGWVIKNANPNALANPESSDRLIDLSAIPQEVPAEEAQASDDILNDNDSPVANKFRSMITSSAKAHRQQLMDELNSIRSNEAAKQQSNPSYWFMSKSTGQNTQQAPAPAASIPSAPASADDAALATQLKATSAADDVSTARMRTLKPAGDASSQNGNQQAPTTVTPPSHPAILSLANNNDLNVSTLARQASKAKNGGEPQDEVVVSLH